MLSDSELAALFGDEETDRVERKESAGDPSKIKEAICAFANDFPDHRRPGVIFVGQRNDLSCAGLNIDDQLLLTLGGWRSDGTILPFPAMAVRKAVIDGCTLAVIVVNASDNPPVRFNGRTWIRVGPRRATATVQEENILVERRQWLSLPYDARGVSSAGIDDLDLDRFSREYLPVAFSRSILEENGRSREQQLRALRLLDAEGRPTATALLMLGLEPRRWFPGAYVQFLRVDGLIATDPIIDQREVGGALGDQLRELDGLIDLNIQTAAVVGGTTRIETQTFPPEALRQLVRNALIHRSYQDAYSPVRMTWYNDRVEIISPGGPFGRVTAQTFGQPGVTDYRNPTLAESMKTLGFVDRFGVGLEIVRESLERNGSPSAEFITSHEFVTVILRTRS